MAKTCLECKNCGVDSAEYDWSDVTPGGAMGWYCYKHVWDFDAYDCSKKSIMDMITSAETCELFEQSESL